MLLLVLWLLAVAIHTTKALEFTQNEINLIESKRCVGPSCGRTPEILARRQRVKEAHISRFVSLSQKRSSAQDEAEETLRAVFKAKVAALRSMGFTKIVPDDDGLWQGDIILTKEQAKHLIRYYESKSLRGRTKRDVMWFEKMPLKRWTMPIQYTVSEDAPEEQKKAVASGLAVITAHTPCITFKATTTPSGNYIKYNLAQEMSCHGAAFLGMSAGENGIDLDISDCAANDDRGQAGSQAQRKVIHETYHGLGLEHEHCRRDRDKYIKINTTNLTPDGPAQYAEDYTSFTSYGAPYNFSSVMHYAGWAFAADSKYNAWNPIVNVPPAVLANVGRTYTPATSDDVLTRRAYCQNPNPMLGTVLYQFGNIAGCYSTCPTDPKTVSDPPECPQPDYKESRASSAYCLKCSKGACSGDTAWEAIAFSSGPKAGYTCSASSPFFFYKVRECKPARPDTCQDTRVDCGDDALATPSRCSQAAVAKDCPKSCNRCTTIG